MSYDVSDFASEVIETSFATPVLVDFWAPWCGPCRALGPVLEKLAGESEGQWKLAKVNTDQNPDVAQEYEIRGIPAVKLIHQGKVIDEFTGALPEYAVAQWLQKALPSERKQWLAQAETALEDGNDALAEQLLRKILAEDPTHPRAAVLLARLRVFDQPDEAVSLAGTASFAGAESVQLEEAVKTMAALLQRNTGDGSLPDGPARDAYAEALVALQEKNFDRAAERFIDVIRRDRYYEDDAARRACVALFNLLGPAHPVTRKYRRIFDMSLY